MVDCDYCGESFPDATEDDDEFLDHLASEHADEVSRIDERRLETQWSGDLEEARGPNYRFSALQIGGIVTAGVFVVGVFAVVMAGGLGSGSSSQVDGGWVYEQGTINVTVDGEPVELYERGDSDRFYVQEDGETWRMNVPAEQRLNVSEALSRLNIQANESAVRIDGEEYRASQSSVEIRLSVNGDTATFDTELQQGDTVNLTVRTAS